MPSESLENQFENIVWIVLSMSLFIMSTSAMNKLSVGLDSQRLRATALIVKDCLDLSWKSGCTLTVTFPNDLGRGKMRVEVRAGTVTASNGNAVSKMGLDVPVRDAVILSGKTYRIFRTDGYVGIEEEGEGS